MPYAVRQAPKGGNETDNTITRFATLESLKNKAANGAKAQTKGIKTTLIPRPTKNRPLTMF